MDNLLDHVDGRVTVRLVYDSKRCAYVLCVQVRDGDAFVHRFVLVPEDHAQICNNTRKSATQYAVTIVAGDFRATLEGLERKEALMIAAMVERAYLTAWDHFVKRGQMRLANGS